MTEFKNPAIIEFTIEEPTDICFDFCECDCQDNIQMDMETGIPVGGTKDYRKLINLPSINNETLIENYNEIDPTVPEWAKGYEPERLGDTKVEFLWRSIFG